MTRRPYWRGSTPRREGRSERDWGMVEADREAARNRPAGEGLRWVKMDLHIHTPASSDYRDPGVTYLDILKKAEEMGLDLIAFADHNTIAGYAAMHREIETLTLLERLGRMTDEERNTLKEYRRLLDKIKVLPAFEFTATFGFHILGVFPENSSVRKLEYLLLNLNVPEERMVIGAPDVGSTTDVLGAYAAIVQAGGIAIAAHANSSNGVAMQGFPFGGQTKIAYTQDLNLIALEVTDLESTGRRTTAAFYNGTKTEYPRRMHCIQGSDAHSLETEQSDSHNKRLGVGGRITEILARDASFASLKEVLGGTDFTRTRPHRANWLWDLVEAARTQGPNVAQSFHERAVTHTSRTRPILHDVVAFANTSGGTIYVGANPDKRIPLHGLEHAEEDAHILRDDIRSTLDPPIEVEVDVRPNGPRAIIVISVPEGDKKPYLFIPTSQIYVRTRADTHVASRQEIIDLVLSAQGGGQPSTTRRQPSVVSQPTTASAGEPMSPGQPPPKAVPVPTHGIERPTREQPPQRQPEREQPVEVPRADSRRQTAGDKRAQPPTPVQPQQERPRPAWMANLPPERIKGQLQPMAKPEQAPAPQPVPEAGPVEQDMVAGGVAMDAPLTKEAPPEEATAKKPRRGRTRKAAAAEEAAEVPEQAQLDTPMEATVAAEHHTREEIVAESAETIEEKPKRGRRKRKAEPELQVEAPTAASAETQAGQEAILVEAEVEPGPQIPAEVSEVAEAAPAKKSRSRRKSAAQEAALESPPQEPPAQVAPPAEEAPAKAKSKRGSRKKASAPEAKAPHSSPPDPPTTGVEIVAVEERGGNQYHTMRDLRNGQTVHNVTRQSARRLWLYAVQQHRRGAPEVSEVYWHPDAPIGLWRKDNRAGATRYDLVARQPDGTSRIFYGVTPDGLRGPWVEVARLAEEAGYEGPEPAE